MRALKVTYDRKGPATENLNKKYTRNISGFSSFKKLSSFKYESNISIFVKTKNKASKGNLRPKI